MATTLVLQNLCKIVNGPSRDAMFDDLRLGDELKKRTVTFTFKIAGADYTLPVRITGIKRSGIGGPSWFVWLEFLVNTYGANIECGEDFMLIYSTDKRSGVTSCNN